MIHLQHLSITHFFELNCILLKGAVTLPPSTTKTKIYNKSEILLFGSILSIIKS